MSFMSRVISSETVLPNLEHQLSRVSEIKKKVRKEDANAHQEAHDSDEERDDKGDRVRRIYHAVEGSGVWRGTRN